MSAKHNVFDSFFYPKSVALIGISSDETKFGGRYLKTLREFGFSGEIYPVHPKETEVFGLKVYPTVKDIPNPVDFAIICVPARFVPSVLEDCLEKGIGAAEIFSSGFSEIGEEEGYKLEEELIQKSKKGIRIIGPNCFGVYCPAGGLTLLPGADFSKESGPVGLISQSGGYASEFCRQVKGYGIDLSKGVSYGNACDINESDLLEYFASDVDTKIIVAYLEGPKDGKRFVRALKDVTMKKPVIIWKAGLTHAGARAVSSHTGSLAGEEVIWDTIFTQTGATRVKNLEELLDTTLAFLHLPPSTGRQLAVIGGGGGISVAAADACEQAGLEIHPLPSTLQEQLKAFIPPVGTSIRNPIDVGSPMPPLEVAQKALEIAASDQKVQTLIATQALHTFLSGNPGVFADRGENFVQDSLRLPLDVRDKYGKPIVLVLSIGSTEIEMVKEEKMRREFRDFYFKHGIPVYPTLERAAASVARVAKYYHFKKNR
ncbi:MAG: CoA-binding protein [Thermodesulfobacteriota bacterium]|nr:CoA-binding protein [Thermodesulfobacteriota bacterium]